MKKFPGANLWVSIDWKGEVVKNLSFFGEIKDYQKALLESMASLLIGSPISRISSLSVRECEAFLRDKNSELSIIQMTEIEEKNLLGIFHWIATFKNKVNGGSYKFSSEKGLFSDLKLTDKIREIKAFLESDEILTLYKNSVKPELVDVEDLTVYISAPYDSSDEKELFEKLHLRGMEVFDEGSLNFIPEN